MARFTKNLRLIKLTEYLSINKHYVTAEMLAEHFGVTVRTIYRDLDDLGKLGCPIYNDRGYKMHQSPKMHPWSLTPEDVRNIQLFLQSSPLSQHDDYKKQIATLILKLKSSVQTQTASESVPIQSAESSPFINRRFNMKDIESALSKQLISEVNYHSLDDDAPRWRNLYPHAMAIREGKWYLIAKDEATKEMRLYRLERIQDFRLTKKTFKRVSNFSIEEYFKDSWSVFRGKKQTVKLRLRGMAVRVIQERHWIKPKTWKQVSSDDVICTITVQGTEEILSWALSMAPHVEILSPKPLREKMKIILSETLKQHKID